MTLVFAPAIPLWALAGVAIASLLIAGFSLFRNWRSGVFRAVALIALIALLANPMLRRADAEPLSDIALILVDESASQSFGERAQAAARARDQLRRAIDAVDGVEARVVDFGGEEETRVIDALRRSLVDIPRAQLSAALIITDGQASDHAEAIGALEAPVHVVVTGDADEIDRKITLTNAPRFGIVDKSVRVTFRIDDLGPDETPLEEGDSAMVSLKVDGEPVLQQPVPLGLEAGFDAPLLRPGDTVIELSVEPRPDELTTRNNIAVLPISAVRDRLRVLLISGEPHPGERVWRNLLKSDPAVDLVHFTILRPIEKNDNTPVSELALIQFPQDELFIEKLNEFDLIIFDRYTYRAVLDSFHFDNVARYVETGGAVLISSGPEFNGARSLASRRNLSFILPASPTGAAIERPFRPELSDLGKRHPVTADLSNQDIWGRWMRIMPVDQRRGQTLMADPDGQPLLILDRVEAGRVGLILSDHVWLWARGFDGGGPHAELLRRVAHWLMKEPELEEEALRLSQAGDDLIVTRRTIEDAVDPVAVETPDGETIDLALVPAGDGLFEGRLNEAPRGLYRARSGQLFAIGAVGLAAPPELEDVISTTQKLRPLAAQTGGGVFRIDTTSAAPAVRRVNAGNMASGENWAGLVRRNASRVEAVRDAPAVAPILWLLTIAASLMAAWLVESGRFRAKPAPATD
ncbi:MAG: hypothetical protein AAFW81_04860 [Pseudomonadota bacterium]